MFDWKNIWSKQSIYIWFISDNCQLEGEAVKEEGNVLYRGKCSWIFVTYEYHIKLEKRRGQNQGFWMGKNQKKSCVMGQQGGIWN